MNLNYIKIVFLIKIQIHSSDNFHNLISPSSLVETNTLGIVSDHLTVFTSCECACALDAINSYDG